MKTLTLTVLAVLVYAASAQYNNGPVPPRLLIPGAIPLGPKPTGNRQARILQSPPQGQPVARIRRPGQQRAGAFKSVASPSPFLQQLDDIQKPVNEESEELQDVSTPQPFLSNPSPFSSPSPIHDDLSLILNASPPPRPIPYPTAAPVPTAPPTNPPEPIRQSQPIRPLPQNNPVPIRFEPQLSKYDGPVRQQQPVRLAPLSFRPQRPQQRPQIEEEEEEPVRHNYRQPAPRPQQQQPQLVNPPAQRVKPNREKKPVAQVIRKYQEENEDGSITWGFENDDGSFKEETIGVDCVTRGRYGYVDPDGLKREYSYETGIPCDKTKEDTEEKGFIDYEGNKAVLPNGVMIDLAAMGKKSRRPNFQPQQIRY